LPGCLLVSLRAVFALKHILTIRLKQRRLLGVRSTDGLSALLSFLEIFLLGQFLVIRLHLVVLLNLPLHFEFLNGVRVKGEVVEYAAAFQLFVLAMTLVR